MVTILKEYFVVYSVYVTRHNRTESQKTLFGPTIQSLAPSSIDTRCSLQNTQLHFV